jgi:hypothetical protein
MRAFGAHLLRRATWQQAMRAEVILRSESLWSAAGLMVAPVVFSNPIALKEVSSPRSFAASSQPVLEGVLLVIPQKHSLGHDNLNEPRSRSALPRVLGADIGLRPPWLKFACPNR